MKAWFSTRRAAAIVSPRRAGPPSCRPITCANWSARQRERGVCKIMINGCPACVPEPQLDVFKAIGLIRVPGASMGSLTRRTIAGGNTR